MSASEPIRGGTRPRLPGGATIQSTSARNRPFLASENPLKLPSRSLHTGMESEGAAMRRSEATRVDGRHRMAGKPRRSQSRRFAAPNEYRCARFPQSTSSTAPKGAGWGSPRRPMSCQRRTQRLTIKLSLSETHGLLPVGRCRVSDRGESHAAAERPFGHLRVVANALRISGAVRDPSPL